MPILTKRRNRASDESSAPDARTPEASVPFVWPCPPPSFYVRVFCAADKIRTPEQALEWLSDRGVYLWVDSVAKIPAGGLVTRIEVPAPAAKVAAAPRSFQGKIAKVDVERKRILLALPAHEAGRYDSAFLRYDNKTKVFVAGRLARVARLEPDMQVAVTTRDGIISRLEVDGQEPAPAPVQKEEAAPKGTRVQLAGMDHKARTITVARLAADVTPSGPVAITIDAKTEILLDGRKVDLPALEPRQHIVATPSQGPATRIVATSPGASPIEARHATVVKVDAKKLLITAAITNDEDVASQDIIVANEFTEVFIHNRPATFADLRPGQHIIVIPLNGIATRIEVPPEGFELQRSLRATVMNVDLATKTLTADPLPDTEEQANEATLRLDDKLAVVIRGTSGRLADLRIDQEVVISGAAEPFTIHWQKATFRWNRRDTQILLECERCETPDSTGRHEVSWFQAHLTGSVGRKALPGPIADSTPDQTAGPLKRLPLALRGLIWRYLGKQRHRVLRHLQSTKVVILTKIDKADASVHRTRMKLMEYYASQCDGLIQIDGSGFYHEGRLLLKIAQRSQAKGLRFTRPKFVIDGAEVES